MKRAKLVFTTAMVLAAAATQAATVNLQWNDPKEYRDIRATQDNQKRFEQRVIRELEEEFRDEAAKLPEGQSLHIAVRDVDLAGTIEYFYRNYPSGLRVVRNIDFPQLEFSYELRDSNNKVIKAGEEHLADLGFRSLTIMPIDYSPLRYERAMIREWYEHRF